MQNLIQKLQAIQNFLSNDVYDVVGVEAENFYKQSFDNEGFTDASLEKWKDVKRRTNPRPGPKGKTAAGWPILHNTKFLGDSIHYEVRQPYVVIHASGKGNHGGKIAKVHNEGGKAGRTAKQFDMPQRKFIGQSETLNKQLFDKIKQKIDAL